MLSQLIPLTFFDNQSTYRPTAHSHDIRVFIFLQYSHTHIRGFAFCHIHALLIKKYKKRTWQLVDDASAFLSVLTFTATIDNNKSAREICAVCRLFANIANPRDLCFNVSHKARQFLNCHFTEVNFSIVGQWQENRRKIDLSVAPIREFMNNRHYSSSS